MGQDDWSKPPLKLPQFMNYYKRTKSKFAKPPTPGACLNNRQITTYAPSVPHNSPGWGEWGFTLTSALKVEPGSSTVV